MKRVVGEWHGTGMQLIKLILQYSVMPYVVRFSPLSMCSVKLIQVVQHSILNNL